MAHRFAEYIRSVVEPLFGRNFTEADGIPQAQLDAIRDRTAYELPEVLRDFYAVVGRFDPVMKAHDR